MLVTKLAWVVLCGGSACFCLWQASRCGAPFWVGPTCSPCLPVPSPLTRAFFISVAGPAQVIPIFKGDKAFDASGRPLRKSLALPTWSKLAGKDRLELDMQLSCEGSSDAGKCRRYRFGLGLAWLGWAGLGDWFGDSMSGAAWMVTA